MYDSYAWYNHMLSDASQMKNMPEVVCPTCEFAVEHISMKRLFLPVFIAIDSLDW